MGGFFGVASKHDCIKYLFYGTDYHSHLGTKRGGLSVFNEGGFVRFTHDITNDQFKSQFIEDIDKLKGRNGIGVISDYEDQPLIIGSHLGAYSIITVGVVKNLEVLARKAFEKRTTHFTEMSGNEINPSELVATLINQGKTFEEGIKIAQELIEGSCSILILTENGIYAARDLYGRTPVIIGKNSESIAVTMETAAFPNLEYETFYELGPGECVFITAEGVENRILPRNKLQICAFLWVYYGYPASTYEGKNVEEMRYKSGSFLAKNDNVKIDFVAGIPDSGIAHAIGYSNESLVPYKRPFVKYTPSWTRSFMPQNQEIRDLIARMKLIPIKELTANSKILFCDDSIVRGTQLKDTFKRIYDYGAKEIHMRIACPPLLYSCKFLNFSRSRSEFDLAGRKAIKELEGEKEFNIKDYADPSSKKFCSMVDCIQKKLGLTTLKYQKLEDMIKAIGLPKEKICTYCWTGE